MPGQYSQHVPYLGLFLIPSLEGRYLPGTFGSFASLPLEGRIATLGPKGCSKAGEGLLHHAQ
jgi:hypothetical protein